MQLGRLQNDLNSTLQSKRDTTLPKAAKHQQQSLAPVRMPPAIKSRRALKGHFGKVTALHWASNSTSVVSASQDGNLILWNAVTANKTQAISLKSNYVMSVGIEQTENQMVACGGLDNLCTVYRLSDPERPVEMASHDGFISCCRFVNQDHILTSSGDSTILRWDVASGRMIDRFAEHMGDAMFLSIRPNDKNTFLSCSVDRTIKLWDIRAPSKSQMTFTGHTDDVNCVDFMPSDNTTFASCGEDGTVRIFDLRSYQELNKFGEERPPPESMGEGMPGEGITSMCFSRSGRLIFCGHANGSILAFDSLSRSIAPTYTINNAHDGHISCIGASPNGDGICTGSWDFNLRIWA